MPILDQVVADLDAMSADLDDIVAGLTPGQWALSTPSAGWTIAHQIAHLAWTDEAATSSITDPGRFDEILRAAVDDVTGFVDSSAENGAQRSPDEILARWRSARTELAHGLLGVPDGTKIRWFGPPMSASSMATARLMETWAHGLDVADALGGTLAVTDRLKAIVHIGVRTRDFAYAVNAKIPPVDPFRFEIVAPSGAMWTWGPPEATDVVRAPALDFCQLVTQRRALADLEVTLIGADAHEWASIAQCFAGPPGRGRAPVGQSRADQTERTDS